MLRPFSKMNGPEPPRDMLARMPQRNMDKEATLYYLQDFKIAWATLEYSSVMTFIRNADYNGIRFLLQDIVIIIDYAESFDKYGVINHLTSNKGFREEGAAYEEDAYRTVVNNDSTVGNNCQTLIERIDGFITRQKIYNKMVQSLEFKSVWSTVGCH